MPDFTLLSPVERRVAIVAHVAGMPGPIVDEILAAEGHYTMTAAEEFWSYGEKTRKARARFDAALEAGRLWREAHQPSADLSNAIARVERALQKATVP